MDCHNVTVIRDSDMWQWYVTYQHCDNGHSQQCRCYWLMILVLMFSQIQRWNRKCLPQRAPSERTEGDPLVKYNLSLKEIEITRWIFKRDLNYALGKVTLADTRVWSSGAKSVNSGTKTEIFTCRTPKVLLCCLQMRCRKFAEPKL